MKRTLTTLFALAAMSGTALGQTIEIDESAFSLGTLTRAEGALADDLWAGADAQLVAEALEAMPRRFAEPAFLDLTRRVLLSPAQAPEGATDALAGAKLLAAAEAGFYREAGELAELAPQLSRQPSLTKVAALSALLDRDVRTACTRGARLTQGRADPFFLQLRYLCYVDTGETSAADLTLGLLRDQGLLSDGADRVFTALQTSGSLGNAVSPEDAFQYAAAQMLGADVSPSAVPELPGSVLAAVARDTGADTALRLPALERAISLGLIGPDEGQRLAAEMTETGLAAEVVAVATERPGSLASAEAVARSLGAAPSYDGFRARAILFGEAIDAAEPMLGYAPFADMLALGAIVAGDEEAAAAWTEAYRAEEGAEAGRAEALGQLLALARGETDVSSLPLSDPLAEGARGVPGLTAMALGAARHGSAGEAALVALSGLGVAAEGEAEAIREAVVLAMLEQSGQAGAVARRVALDTEAAALFAAIQGGETATTGDPVPRIKPQAQ